MRVRFAWIAPAVFQKVGKKWEDFFEKVWYDSNAESGGHLKERRRIQRA